eukprot:scaffold18079_cov65-Phaeocystis_antarctica.AAC.8
MSSASQTKSTRPPRGAARSGASACSRVTAPAPAPSKQEVSKHVHDGIASYTASTLYTTLCKPLTLHWHTYYLLLTYLLTHLRQRSAARGGIAQVGSVEGGQTSRHQVRPPARGAREQPPIVSTALLSTAIARKRL